MNSGGPIRLMVRREWRLLTRNRASVGAVLLLVAVAWLPPLLVSLRTGRLGLGAFVDVTPMALAVGGVVLPLLALLAGADLLAGEIDDGWLVSVVTLPISRKICFVGKVIGRASAFSAAYLLVFGSVGLTIAFTNGSSGLRDYVVVAVAGLLLACSCGAIGAALAARGRGRIVAYASSLLIWVLLVFALDALMLAAIVLLSPEAPETIGSHGHDELAQEMVEMHQDHPYQPAAGLLLLNPVDLFRLTSVTFSPELRSRWISTGQPTPMTATWTVAAWLFWILVPTAVGMRLFSTVRLL